MEMEAAEAAVKVAENLIKMNVNPEEGGRREAGSV